MECEIWNRNNLQLVTGISSYGSYLPGTFTEGVCIGAGFAFPATNKGLIYIPI
jgi:hypothetical protein